MPPTQSSKVDLDQIKRQYMKRATTVLVRSAGYDSASGFALDALCDVGILYMQSLFTQAHAYGEHATRTRPNMNDVGRALEQRHVAVTALLQHMERERPAHQRALVQQLRQAAARLGTEGTYSGEFSSDRAEAVLRQVVEHKKDKIRAAAAAAEQAARERADAERQAAEAAAEETAAAGAERTVTFGEDRVIEDDEDEDDVFETPAEPVAGREEAEEEKEERAEERDQSGEQLARQLEDIDAMLLPARQLPSHVPAHCPRLPCPHTYKRTAVLPQRSQDVFVMRMHKAEQSRQAEENLQRLVAQKTQAQEHRSGRPRSEARQGGARQRIQEMFPAANFRHVDKRARLSSQTL